MGAEVLRTRLRLGGGSALCRCRATEVLALFAVGDVYVSHCKKALMLNLAHGEGREHYFGCNLVQRKVLGVPSIYSSASPWVGSQPCGAKYPGFCANSKGVYADDLWSISKGRVLAQDGVKMCLTVKKLPSDVFKFFKEQGARGGRIGGKRSLETMTAAQRAARAKKASKAAAEMRKVKAEKTKGTVRKRVASRNGPVT